MNQRPSGTRSVALVGSYLSGKTTLLESLLLATGKIARRGAVGDGSAVGDSSAEARARGMSVEVNVATTEFMGDTFNFVDCPGSIEFWQDSSDALMGVDAAVVVCEADPTKAAALAPLLKRLDELELPRILFVNKIDRGTGRVRDLLPALQAVSDKPLALRHVPIRDGETVTGYVDLASERAYVYHDGEASERIDLPESMNDRESEARYELLEKLADFDDKLMEQLLEDVEPPNDEVYEQLAKDFAEGHVVPVLLGAAEHDAGVRRLLKELRHEVPTADATRERRGIDPDGEVLAQVLKTYHTTRGGKLSVARVWRGKLSDGMTLNGERVSGLFTMVGQQTEKRRDAGPGDIVALGRLEHINTGDVLEPGKDGTAKLPVADIDQSFQVAPVVDTGLGRIRVHHWWASFWVRVWQTTEARIMGA
ncbi:MAG: elongation factor G [Alphaproteobacteria bacterium]|jgi:elongation factor G|nr:elongation factor G [Alphaproteobacteria bacterium]MBT5860715.1 elongation factor G [Alphaproteobacteria bacterium]